MGFTCIVSFPPDTDLARSDDAALCSGASRGSEWFLSLCEVTYSLEQNSSLVPTARALSAQLLGQGDSGSRTVTMHWSYTCQDWERLTASDGKIKVLIPQGLEELPSQEETVRQMARQSPRPRPGGAPQVQGPRVASAPLLRTLLPLSPSFILPSPCAYIPPKPPGCLSGDTACPVWPVLGSPRAALWASWELEWGVSSLTISTSRCSSYEHLFSVV